ncbi:uncharacterized protein LOC123722408 [Papilio machaon]|uniref:uncharacterized protein LOC123722408 n=1 Tax=Papilio machaon TaxID=76193 RepID=UPI001E6656AC|nr:uncharacterized protein LOC123722408 [Papilio machaon]
MASKSLLLNDLKVAELRNELEERDLDASGKKSELRRKLRLALEEEGKDPDTFVFEITSAVGVSTIVEKIGETCRILTEKVIDMEETSKNFKEKVNKDIEKFEQQIIDIKLQIAAFQMSEPKDKSCKDNDTVRQSTSHSAIDTELTKMHLKVPEFDGKTCWSNYYRQFEAASRANSWTDSEKALALTLALRGEATNILQTVSIKEQDDYNVLVKHLELRFGQSHLEHVYHSQLKNRVQKQNETLQEFEADVVRLARLAYPATPENVMERLAIQAFLDGLRDQETRRALILARPEKLVDALARALEFEAAKDTCRGLVRVRMMENSHEEATIEEEIVRRVIKEMMPVKTRLRCWHCGKVGHVRSMCKEAAHIIVKKIATLLGLWQVRTFTWSLRERG